MKPVELVTDTAACSGCGLCLAVCPKQAITMEADETGVLYPRIDPQRCVHCNACVKACSIHKKPAANQPLDAWAAVGRDDKLVKNSASGGVFATLAKAVVAGGGMAAGAVLDCGETLQVTHVLSDQPVQLERMQGSKYVQSAAWQCYSAVTEALNTGKTVLFSGTPCQVAAVKALSGNPDNLITLDLICHGVPPVKMLADYSRILQRRFGGKLTALCFRDKAVNKEFCARLELQRAGKKRTLRLRARDLSFYHYFLEGVTYRESCYSCPYACQARVSDLTAGDYWGIEAHHRQQLESGEMPSVRSWSSLLVNTPKGQRFLAEYGQQLRLFATRTEWIALQNRQLNTPSRMPENRTSVLQLYAKGGCKAVEKEFIRSRGGAVRYAWRTLKSLRQLCKEI